MVSVPEAELLRLVRRLVEFPYPQVCKHLAAGALLDLLEKHGYPLSDELARAVVQADDAKALALLASE